MNYKYVIGFIFIVCAGSASIGHAAAHTSLSSSSSSSSRQNGSSSSSSTTATSTIQRQLALPVDLLSLVFLYSAVPDPLVGSSGYSEIPFKHTISYSLRAPLYPIYSPDRSLVASAQPHGAGYAFFVHNTIAGATTCNKSFSFNPCQPACCSWSCEGTYLACKTNTLESKFLLIDPLKNNVAEKMPIIDSFAWSCVNDKEIAIAKFADSSWSPQQIGIYSLYGGKLIRKSCFVMPEISSTLPSHLFWSPKVDTFIVVQQAHNNPELFYCIAYRQTGTCMYNLRIKIPKDAISVTFSENGALMAIVTTTGVNIYETATGILKADHTIAYAHNTAWIDNNALCVTICAENPHAIIIDAHTGVVLDTLSIPNSELAVKQGLYVQYHRKTQELVINSFDKSTTADTNQQGKHLLSVWQRMPTKRIIHALLYKPAPSPETPAI